MNKLTVRYKNGNELVLKTKPKYDIMRFVEKYTAAKERLLFACIQKDPNRLYEPAYIIDNRKVEE